MKKIRKNKKGFTLVEIIIVIAIIAILAAILIPTMSGYITAAEDQQYIANARAAYVAALFNKETGQSIDDGVSGTFDLDKMTYSEDGVTVDLSGGKAIVTRK
ncbi:MAG: prepilin-type N-terminal cleavage/methylation domain-containing protein [Christensenellales bacterium]